MPASTTTHRAPSSAARAVSGSLMLVHFAQNIDRLFGTYVVQGVVAAPSLARARRALLKAFPQDGRRRQSGRPARAGQGDARLSPRRQHRRRLRRLSGSRAHLERLLLGVSMATRCEDYPGCGHGPAPLGDNGGCPDAEGRFACVGCGKLMPRGAHSALCVTCHRRPSWRDEDDDDA